MQNGFDNPLSSDKDEEFLPETGEEGRLPSVARGRMFCLQHGRECYQQFSIIGEKAWVCPDERHQDKLAS